MIHRNLITEIENWAKNPKRKPLVLRVQGKLEKQH